MPSDIGGELAGFPLWQWAHINTASMTVKPSSKSTLIDRTWSYVVRTLYRRPRMYVTKADVISADLPRDVGIEITNICNANCSFCGYGKGDDGKAADPRAKGKLKIEVFRHLLSLYAAAGGGQFALSPILGEVSAHPEWLSLVREARATTGISGVTCFTNAILIDRFGFTEIIKSGLTSINISTALGSREQYQRLYGVDKYDKVLANILGLLKCNYEHGSPVEISLLLRLDKPFSDFFDSPIYDEITRYLPAHKIQVLDDDWDDFKGLIPLEGLPRGHVFKPLRPERRTEPCYALFRKLQVLTDGTIQGCSCRIEPDLWVGNILDYKSLQDVWRAPQLVQLRDQWFSGHVPSCCVKCTHYQPYTELVEATRPGALLRTIGMALVRRIWPRR